VAKELKRFREFLQSREYRLTEQRRRIVEMAFARRDHFSADDLEETAREQGIPVSKATIYRALSLLVECGLLEAHDFGTGYKRYERAFGHDHHDHLFCVTCGQIEEFLNPEIERLQERVIAEHGFLPTSHSLKIYGYCPGCVAKGRGRHVRRPRVRGPRPGRPGAPEGA